MKNRSIWFNAVIGAGVTIILSFTGFSPLIGGAVAGYLQQESPKRGATIGAIAGVIAIVPIIGLIVLGIAFVFLVGSVSTGIPGGLELGIILLILFPLLFLWIIAASGLGGYLGAYLYTRSQSNGNDPISPHSE